MNFHIVAQSTAFDIPTWLGDSGWWQVILAVVAILITFAFYFKQKQKKSLSYIVLANTPLLSVDQKIRGRVQILLDGKPVDNVHYLLVKFVNTGSDEIVPTDIVKPVSMELGNDAQIISAEVDEAEPSDLDVKVLFDKNKITVDMSLLNIGDFFVLKVLANKNPAPLSFSARIKGVKQLTPYIEARPFGSLFEAFFRDKVSLIVITIFVVFVSLVGVINGFITGNYGVLWFAPVWLLIIVGGMLISAIIILPIAVIASRIRRSNRRNTAAKTTKP
jgi:hypothetical protein